MTGRRGFRTSDYEFHLPPERVAQRPEGIRDASRLLVVRRNAGSLEHRQFTDLPALLEPGDILALNVTRVLRARLLGTRDSGAPAEVFLVKRLDEGRWEAMVHPGGKVRPGRTVFVAPELSVEIESITERRTRIVRLVTPLPEFEAIERFGHVPLPPYVRRPDEPGDAERYQTVFARESGSVAAPTAGLHFTPEVLERLTRRGVERAELVLHVGAGTFKPVEVEDPGEHRMHEEWFRLDRETADRLNAARAAGGKVVAVGTTSLRTLESRVQEGGGYMPGEGETRIFIRPPHRVRGADALLTNFHLPRSTLIMLVAAMAGYELTMHAYQQAIDHGYRFYSYGDAMLIL